MFPKDKPFEVVCKTFAGLEEPLANEINKLLPGNATAKAGRRAVLAKVNLTELYTIVARSYLCVKPLVSFKKFKAQNSDQIYENAVKLPWASYITPVHTFSIECVAHSEVHTHNQYAALRLKDAIVDQVRRAAGQRPSVDTNQPNFKIHMAIRDTDVTLLWDAGGRPLNQRGYRASGGQAPLNECLAAGLLQIAGYNGTMPLADPMCGSGTLSIEAALMANGIPPADLRADYCLKYWPGFNKAAWQKACEVSAEPARPRIMASDDSRRMVSLARNNALKAGLGNKIEVFAKDFFKLEPIEEKGILILNPPYGERLETPAEFYKQLGNRLKSHWGGWTVWVISSDRDELRNIGLRPERKIVVYNGPLEARFQKYKMYDGTKRNKFADDK